MLELWHGEKTWVLKANSFISSSTVVMTSARRRDGDEVVPHVTEKKNMSVSEKPCTFAS